MLPLLLPLLSSLLCFSLAELRFSTALPFLLSLLPEPVLEALPLESLLLLLELLLFEMSSCPCSRPLPSSRTCTELKAVSRRYEVLLRMEDLRFGRGRSRRG
jgi:hypothetical protein